MKRIVTFLVLFLAQIGVAFSADNSIYFGAKAGLMMPGISEMDSAVNVGIFAGSKLANNISVEGEMTVTAINGDINIFGIPGEWDVLTLAGYGVYRSNNSDGMYFKGKAGLLYEDINMDIAGFGSASGNDTGLSFGFGVGFDVGNGKMLEIEYTIIESDVDFLSVGIMF